jgi:hypothetical protein
VKERELQDLDVLFCTSGNAINDSFKPLSSKFQSATSGILGSVRKGAGGRCKEQSCHGVTLTRKWFDGFFSGLSLSEEFIDSFVCVFGYINHRRFRSRQNMILHTSFGDGLYIS